MSGERRVAITTLPLMADVVGKIDVDAWLYYCVDDFSVWPGLDGQIISQMERALVPRMARLIAVSESLQSRLASMGGYDSELLTHGIDPEHWNLSRRAASHPLLVADVPAPRLVFWGVVDQRLDTAWCLALADHCGELVLIGPEQDADAALARHPRIHLLGPVSYEMLPSVAAIADVLVMPYAELPVTRAMQPLKFKEYLATGRPVVARRLPSVAEWDDAADLVDSARELVHRVNNCVRDGVTKSQLLARQRLSDETWKAKARLFESAIRSCCAPERRVVAEQSR